LQQKNPRLLYYYFRKAIKVDKTVSFYMGKDALQLKFVEKPFKRSCFWKGKCKFQVKLRHYFKAICKKIVIIVKMFKEDWITFCLSKVFIFEGMDFSWKWSDNMWIFMKKISKQLKWILAIIQALKFSKDSKNL